MRERQSDRATEKRGLLDGAGASRASHSLRLRTKRRTPAAPARPHHTSGQKPQCAMSGDRTGDNDARAVGFHLTTIEMPMRGGAKDGSFDVPAVILVVTIVNVKIRLYTMRIVRAIGARKLAASRDALPFNGQSGQAGVNRGRSSAGAHTRGRTRCGCVLCADKLPEEPSARLSLGSPVGVVVAAASPALAHTPPPSLSLSLSLSLPLSL